MLLGKWMVAGVQKGTGTSFVVGRKLNVGSEAGASGHGTWNTTLRGYMCKKRSSDEDEHL